MMFRRIRYAATGARWMTLLAFAALACPAIATFPAPDKGDSVGRGDAVLYLYIVHARAPVRRTS